MKLLAWLLLVLLVAVVYLLRHPLLRLAGEGLIVDGPLRRRTPSSFLVTTI